MKGFLITMLVLWFIEKWLDYRCSEAGQKAAEEARIRKAIRRKERQRKRNIRYADLNVKLTYCLPWISACWYIFYIGCAVLLGHQILQELNVI